MEPYERVSHNFRMPYVNRDAEVLQGVILQRWENKEPPFAYFKDLTDICKESVWDKLTMAEWLKEIKDTYSGQITHQTLKYFHNRVVKEQLNCFEIFNRTNLGLKREEFKPQIYKSTSGLAFVAVTQEIKESMEYFHTLVRALREINTMTNFKMLYRWEQITVVGKNYEACFHIYAQQKFFVELEVSGLMRRRACYYRMTNHTNLWNIQFFRLTCAGCSESLELDAFGVPNAKIKIQFNAAATGPTAIKELSYQTTMLCANRDFMQNVYFAKSRTGYVSFLPGERHKKMSIGTYMGRDYYPPPDLFRLICEENALGNNAIAQLEMENAVTLRRYRDDLLESRDLEYQTELKFNKMRKILEYVCPALISNANKEMMENPEKANTWVDLVYDQLCANTDHVKLPAALNLDASHE